jgi:hypothetical protein
MCQASSDLPPANTQDQAVLALEPFVYQTVWPILVLWLEQEMACHKSHCSVPSRRPPEHDGEHVLYCWGSESAEYRGD